MEHSLELQRLKAAYEESKHVTKTVLLDGRILRLRSSLCKFLDGVQSKSGRWSDRCLCLVCANYSTMKYQDDLQNAYARTKRDRETMQEQLSVIHQQGVAIQDTKVYIIRKGPSYDCKHSDDNTHRMKRKQLMQKMSVWHK